MPIDEPWEPEDRDRGSSRGDPGRCPGPLPAQVTCRPWLGVRRAEPPRR